MCVHSQQDEHQEEADGPELRQRHHGCSLWVGDEGQTWTWGGGREQEQGPFCGTVQRFMMDLKALSSTHRTRPQCLHQRPADEPWIQEQRKRQIQQWNWCRCSAGWSRRRPWGTDTEKTFPSRQKKADLGSKWFEWVVKKIMCVLIPVISCFVLPIAIVVIVIVAAQDNQSSNSQAICKHYLGCCIFPDLESKEIFTSEQF